MNKIKMELKRLSKAGRTAALVWFGIITAAWAAATIWQMARGSYADAAAELLLFGYIWLIK